MNNDFMSAVDELARKKGISTEVLLKAIEEALMNVNNEKCGETAGGGDVLWSPLNIGGTSAKNRFAILPMECNDALEGGGISRSVIDRYHAYCEGGAGIVIFEGVALRYENRSREYQILLDIYNDENRNQWRKLISDLKAKYPETLLIVQYHHGGEVAAEEFSRRVTVKDLPGFGGELIDEKYIDDYIALQVETAKFLYEIGVDGVDIKLGHGYLGSQILRPYNDREWKYGGPWENRSRYAYDTCEKIRAAVPDEKFLIGARVSMYEEFPGGQGHAGPDSPYIDLTESIELIRGLEARGCSFFIETIGNAYVFWNNMAPEPSCSVNVYDHMTMAKLMKDSLKPETVVIGAGMSVLGDGSSNQLGGVDPDKKSFAYWSNYCVETGGMDVVGIGRQALADPYLPAKFKEGRTGEINWCRMCNMCSDLKSKKEHSGCAVYGKRC